MPFKHDAARRRHIPRARYRVTNWPVYEAGLRRRGDLTLWLDEATLTGWTAPKRSSPGGQPLYFLNEAQQAAVQQLYRKMFAELEADYAYKYDLLRTYVLELIHSAQKLQPATTLYRESTAATRIASLFIELLARQFPIEVQGQRVKLRTAQAFASRLAVHTNHLNRALKVVTGKTTTQLLAERLVQEAQALLRHTDWPVGLIGYSLGFDEPAHFNNFFKKHTGQTPSAARAV